MIKVKTKIIFSLHLLLLIMLIACQNKKLKSDSNDSQNELIVYSENMEKILVSQLNRGQSRSFGEKGLDIPVANKKFEILDFEAIVDIDKKILSSQGYKFIATDKFSFKIKEIFGRTMDLNSDKKFLYVNYLDKCDKNFNYYPYDGIDYNGTYIIKNECFITDFYFIPELIDYKKEFPKAVTIENEIRSTINEGGEIINIKLWKDDKNLNSIRQKNTQALINRNKYLFNDSKTSLVWLKFNDEEFLERLVKTFGYVQDKDLLKWVLDRSLIKLNDNDVDGFAKVLWTKTCDNKIIFHEVVFDIMNGENEKNKKKYVTSLENYISNFKNEGLSFSEVAKIKALVCYYGTNLSASIEPSGVYQFFPVVSGEEYEKEFIKNNYYNISDFKKIYEDTKTGGVSYQGMLD